ncbi:MAG: DUF2628 domain-containing protein [Phaeodactylibacter sp.]|nr:DUF2628 domain-containing protein [Phaeodactylibacter sp.]MCB9289366.1 DUF2628 domain-containing protein [Lewinellaceae bacterium]
MKNILDFPEAEPSVEEASLATFIGPGKEYYLGQWARMQEERALSFHFQALLLGPFWLLYRQMFRETVLYIAFFLGMGLLRWSDLGFWLYEEAFFGMRVLILHLALGFSANRLYLLHCQRRVNKIVETHEPERRKEVLQLKGGVSFLPPIVFLLLSLIWLISNYYQGNYGINTNFIF